MQSIKRNAKSLIKEVDLFGSNITLLHQGKQSKNSVSGGIGTIILLIVCIVIFNTNIRGFFNLQFLSFNITSQIGSENKISLNSSNTFLAIGMTGLNIFQNQLLSLSLQPVTRFANGSRINWPPIQLKRCQKEQWASLGQNYLSYFESNSMQNYVCLSNYNFSLAGQFGSQQFSYVKLTLSPCKKDCPTDLKQRIQNIVKQLGGYLQLNMVYQNTGLNYEETFSPFRHFPDKSYYRFVPYYQQVSVDKYAQLIQVYTDISVFPFEQVVKSKNATFSRNDIFVHLPYLPTQNDFFKCFIRTFNSQTIVQRKVQSLDEFLSFLGGMFSILQVIGMLVFSPYSKHKLLVNIFNQLFCSDSVDLPKDQKLSRTVQPIQTSFFQFFINSLLCDCIKQRFKLVKLQRIDQAISVAQAELQLIPILKRAKLGYSRKQSFQFIDRNSANLNTDIRLEAHNQRQNQHKLELKISEDRPNQSHIYQ